MAETVKSVWDEETTHWKLDRSFAKKIVQYEHQFINQREENLEFLGGALLGTPRFRFFDSDRERWFDELLELDDIGLRRRIHGLSEVDVNHHVSSDVFNLSVLYLVHRLFHSNLSEKERHAGQMSALKVLHYRFLSSLMAHNFKYEPDRRIAEAVYAQLNYRFSLKRLGSWGALIHERCEDILAEDSIHYKTLHEFEPFVGGINYSLNDIQGRIREVVKKLVSLFYEIRDTDVRVSHKSAHVELDGDVELRDIIRTEQKYHRYIFDVLIDRSTFIRSELTEVIEQMMHTMSPKHFHAALVYLSDNAGKRGDRNIEPFVDEIVVHLFEYMRKNKQDFRRNVNLGQILQQLRSIYMSSRSRDPSLMKIRELGQKIVEKAIDSRNPSVISSVRTGCMMYIVLRMLTMNHYTQS